MPARNQTGPLGGGPMSGRGMGKCGGNSNGTGYGRGLGMGHHRGNGLKRGTHHGGRGLGMGRIGFLNDRELTPEEELKILKAEKVQAESDLNMLNEQISILEDIISKKQGE